MTKQEYIEWRRGVMAYKKGNPFSLQQPHSWQMGWLQQSHIQTDIAAGLKPKGIKAMTEREMNRLATLSNPVYTELLTQLAQAKAHLDAAQRIARELVRDGMLDPCASNFVKLSITDACQAESVVKDRARF